MLDNSQHEDLRLSWHKCKTSDAKTHPFSVSNQDVRSSASAAVELTSVFWVITRREVISNHFMPCNNPEDGRILAKTFHSINRLFSGVILLLEYEEKSHTKQKKSWSMQVHCWHVSCKIIRVIK
jgi:hypothetical protein